jgi:hypothetical protein
MPPQQPDRLLDLVDDLLDFSAHGLLVQFGERDLVRRRTGRNSQSHRRPRPPPWLKRGSAGSIEMSVV